MTSHSKAVLATVTMLMFTGFHSSTQAGETSLAGYATYWDGKTEGVGGGVKLRKKFLAFLAADVRGSYITFDDYDTTVVPVEATLMLGIPFIVEPKGRLAKLNLILNTEVAK